MGAERFFTEFYRTNPKTVLGVFSQAQFISIFLFAAGLSLVIYVNWIKKYPGEDSRQNSVVKKVESKE